MVDSPDIKTADAFAYSWNTLPVGSVYTEEQFADWMAPLGPAEIAGKRVLELGCGNGSLMYHLLGWRPRQAVGVDLGRSVESATRTLQTAQGSWKIIRGDLVAFQSEGFDLVYCIGVLHHLQNTDEGFRAVVRNVLPGGQFHCWVYGKEGNGIVRYLVDPLRRLIHRLPYPLIKYGIAPPFAALLFLYSSIVRALPESAWVRRLPLREYCAWISRRGWKFFWHVVTDQLVSPHTKYLSRQDVERLLSMIPEIESTSTYILPRNGNSWKFGGKTKQRSRT